MLRDTWVESGVAWRGRGGEGRGGGSVSGWAALRGGGGGLRRRTGGAARGGVGGGRKGADLREGVQVAEGEGEGDRLVEVDVDRVVRLRGGGGVWWGGLCVREGLAGKGKTAGGWARAPGGRTGGAGRGCPRARLVDGRVLLERDVRAANVPGRAKLNPILGHGDDHWRGAGGKRGRSAVSGRGRAPRPAGAPAGAESEQSPVSPMDERSLQMRWNSPEFILMVAEYSVSGMPRCSLSMSMSLSSNSEMRSWSAARGGGRGGEREARAGKKGTAAGQRGLVRFLAPGGAGRPSAGRRQRACALEHEGHNIPSVISLHGDDVVLVCALEHLALHGRVVETRAPSAPECRRRQ